MNLFIIAAAVLVLFPCTVLALSLIYLFLGRFLDD